MKSETEPTTPADGAPARILTTKEKLIRMGQLLADHALAKLENAELGDLNAHEIKVLSQLIKDAGISPTEGDNVAAQPAAQSMREEIDRIAAEGGFNFPQ